MSEKIDLLKSLYDKYVENFHDKEIVLGDGNVDSQLLLVGEAPGKDEVRLSKPFVGMAGKNLSEFLNVLGIERDSIYITNAIKYRLSEINPKTGRVINRPATKDEIFNNREYLVKEINIINPQYVVTLGNVPLKSILNSNKASIGSMHGEVSKVAIGDGEFKLYPLYHPASIIYNQSIKETYINDVKRLRDILGNF